LPAFKVSIDENLSLCYNHYFKYQLKKEIKVSLNLTSRTIDFLREQEGKQFTAREIARALMERFPDLFQMKKEKSSRLQTDAELLQQIAAEIGAQRPQMQKKCPQIDTSEGRPRKYFHSSTFKTSETAMNSSLVKIIETSVASRTYLEYELYPVLSSYLKSEHQTWCKRIDEKRASNLHGAGANRWLFPDIVGFEDFSSEWEREVKDCAHECAEKQCRLWSFEVKRKITRSNVREVFFQAVSNSSWSHLGYLVAAEIEGEDTLRELRILTARHGIGVIKLDFENPSESQVLIPALVLPDLDWNHINRLSVENSDFRDFIRNVRHFHQTGDVLAKHWDSIGFD